MSRLNIFKTPTLSVLAGVFGCFCSPPNSDMNYGVAVFRRACAIFLLAYKHREARSVVSSEGYFSESAQNLTPEKISGRARSRLACNWHPSTFADYEADAQFSSVQDGIYALGKAHMHSTQSLRSFPNVAFETVPMFV